jgi:hypothetical protein
MHTVHLLQWVLQLVGFGTVMGYISKSYRKVREGHVLSVVRNTDSDGPWHSANGVVGELYLKTALRDARGFFPPRHLTFLSYVRMKFCRSRHALHRLLLPSKKQADNVMQQLWERGLLVRAGWDHTDNEFYRLRN